MPTAEYNKGFRDAVRLMQEAYSNDTSSKFKQLRKGGTPITFSEVTTFPKRKLSAWNKYVKANSKKPRFRMKSGKLNLRKMGIAFRKTPAGKKSKKSRR